MQIRKVDLFRMASAVLEAEERIVTLPGKDSVLEDAINDIKDIVLKTYQAENKRRTVQGVGHIPIDKRLRIR